MWKMSATTLLYKAVSIINYRIGYRWGYWLFSCSHGSWVSGVSDDSTAASLCIVLSTRDTCTTWAEHGVYWRTFFECQFSVAFVLFISWANVIKSLSLSLSLSCVTVIHSPHSASYCGISQTGCLYFVDKTQTLSLPVHKWHDFWFLNR